MNIAINNTIKYLTTTQAAQKFSVSVKTISRWERCPKLNFPRATVINCRRYFDETKLDQWAVNRSE
jgi:DNA-binding transcriptional MerR regulator